MRIGFDLAQASSQRTGCGWYAQSLFQAMAAQTGTHDFVAYRNFAQWLNPPATTLVPLPTGPRVKDPQNGSPPGMIAAEWGQALATGEFPGRPDLVHSTSFQAPRVKDAPLVFTLFDLSFWSVPEFTIDRIRLDCQKGVLDALDHADGLIFISEYSQQEFNRFLPKFRRKTAMKTIITPLASRWPVVPSPAEAAGDYWLFVGSQEPRKNIAGLLEGYEAYVRNHSSPRPLWLAGGAGWKNQAWQPRLSVLEQHGLVRRLGYVSEQSLLELYRRAAALIFPSWYEGFGLPVLEAMSQGCPVICSNRSSMPEVGGEAPLYVDPAQPLEIMTAMKRIENDPGLWSSLARQGLQQACKFSWSTVARQTIAFYEEVKSTA
jgi:glycosyltransferase involved in cell wall biosynthesis